MPINIFQPKSFVEKGVEFMKWAPYFLERASTYDASTFSGALDRIREVCIFAVSYNHGVV